MIANVFCTSAFTDIACKYMSISIDSIDSVVRFHLRSSNTVLQFVFELSFAKTLGWL